MIASVLRKLPATVIASCVSLSFIWLVPAEVSMMAAGWLVSGTLVGISLLAWALMVRLRLSGLTQSLAWGWGVAAIVSATLGLWQFSGWGWEDTSWIASSPNHEVYANLRQKNHLATLLVMGVIILGWRKELSGMVGNEPVIGLPRSHRIANWGSAVRGVIHIFNRAKIAASA
jgi:Protein glycosylation ligase